MGLQLRHIGINRAREFVGEHHRHHMPPRGSFFCLAAMLDDVIVGVATVGRPVARAFADGVTAEITRLCTTGEKNACSFLYGACRRAAYALGYTRLITYTLETETGTSLRAAGWACVALTRGGSWNRSDRPREDLAPTCKKKRWQAPP